MNSLGEYNDNYGMLDVAQLIHVEENFAKNTHARFKIDLSSFLKLPSLSWEATLKTTRIELEWLTGVIMIHFYEKSIRRKVTSAIPPNAQANIKYSYDYD